MPDDLEVIQRVITGDRESFRLLVERHQGSVWRVVTGLLGPGTDAEDAAQDVFMAAYVHLKSFDAGKATFSTWLLTIARNHCINTMKRRRPMHVANLPELAELRTPETVIAKREWFERLDAALDCLPVEQKTAFVLAEIEGLSLEETAQIEDVPLGTVKSRIARAKQKLRAVLKSPEGVEELR